MKVDVCMIYECAEKLHDNALANVKEKRHREQGAMAEHDLMRNPG